eukprot:1780720-Pyramimonas_sp.AAC.1
MTRSPLSRNGLKRVVERERKRERDRERERERERDNTNFHSDSFLPPSDTEGDGAAPIVVKTVRDLLNVHYGPQSSRAHLSLRNDLI